ncbi:hypothetical protein THIOM_000825 [Candidatus Thiomargarita nelsonii]|uniref:Uncharacterized protein n=1 Tax=Candidatus Thiomargarita nelsonii TaxID=1003181 RepID=A0A176S5Q3_9GAMM|nr:hypothetical protein THIOM_000825 [Candidatus Thiomargarita nelsonii]
MKWCLPFSAFKSCWATLCVVTKNFGNFGQNHRFWLSESRAVVWASNESEAKSLWFKFISAIGEIWHEELCASNKGGMVCRDKKNQFQQNHPA